MARPPSTHPTDAEMEFLIVLWDQGQTGLGQVHAVIQEGDRDRDEIRDLLEASPGVPA